MKKPTLETGLRVLAVASALGVVGWLSVRAYRNANPEPVILQQDLTSVSVQFDASSSLPAASVQMPARPVRAQAPTSVDRIPALDPNAREQMMMSSKSGAVFSHRDFQRRDAGFIGRPSTSPGANPAGTPETYFGTSKSGEVFSGPSLQNAVRPESQQGVK